MSMYGDPVELGKVTKRAQLWYEETNNPTCVFWDSEKERYDFTLQGDIALRNYLLVLLVPQGFVQ